MEIQDVEPVLWNILVYCLFYDMENYLPNSVQMSELCVCVSWIAVCTYYHLAGCLSDVPRLCDSTFVPDSSPLKCRPTCDLTRCYPADTKVNQWSNAPASSESKPFFSCFASYVLSPVRLHQAGKQAEVPFKRTKACWCESTRRKCYFSLPPSCDSSFLVQLQAVFHCLKRKGGKNLFYRQFISEM